MRPELEQQKKDLEAALALPPPAPRLDPHFVRNRDVMLRFLEGQSVEQIAKDLRLDAKQIKAILRRQPIKQEIQRLAGLANDRYVQERIDSLSIEALDIIRDTARGHQFSELRYKAAAKILDLNPLLRANPKSELEQLGVGLGESIITRLAQMESENARKRIDEERTIDITSSSVEESQPRENGSSNETLERETPGTSEASKQGQQGKA